MDIKAITSIDSEWIKVIDYAENCSWKAGINLANAMRNEQFTEWERVFIAIENDDIAGYCTIAKTDCIPDVPYTPYIGFLFVGEKFRGNRISQKLIKKAMAYAKKLGFDKIYLISDHDNLYEKYGFSVIDKKLAYWGAEEKIYMQCLNNNSIIEVNDGLKKSVYTKEVLEKLPEWFGNKQSLDDYVVKVAEFPYWAALNEENNCIGFLSVKIHCGHTGDIFVCGVLPEYHHSGIGKALYNAAESYLIQTGCKYVMAKTLSDAVSYEPYARTRKFYKSIGFEPLVTLTEMWDEENPCLIMLKSLY